MMANIPPNPPNATAIFISGAKPSQFSDRASGSGAGRRALALYKATSVMEAQKEFAARQVLEQKRASAVSDMLRHNFDDEFVTEELTTPSSPLFAEACGFLMDGSLCPDADSREYRNHRVH